MAKDYDFKNPPQPWNVYGISRASQIADPLANGLSSFENNNTGTSVPSQNNPTPVGGLTPYSPNLTPTDNFKYNVAKIINDPVQHDIVNTMLKNSPYQTTLEDLVGRDNKDITQRTYVDTVLDWIDARMKERKPANIVNDVYGIATPADATAVNYEMFSQDVGETPLIEFDKDGKILNSPDFSKVTIIDEATGEEVKSDKFIEGITSPNGKVKMTLRGVLSPDNTQAYLKNNDWLLNGRVYEVQGKTYIMGSNTIPISYSDKIQKDIGKSRYTYGYWNDMTTLKNSKVRANELPYTSTDGRPVFNYDFETKYDELNTMKTDILNNVSTIDKLNSIIDNTLPLQGNDPEDIKILHEYLNTGKISADSPARISNMITNIQDLMKNPNYK